MNQNTTNITFESKQIEGTRLNFRLFSEIYVSKKWRESFYRHCLVII